MKKITDLQFLSIVTEDDKALGHVFDFRSPGVPEHGVNHQERIISELVYGELGLLERFGLKQAQAKTLAWKFVIEIKDGRIIVANEAGT
jgi:hypothetical protein